RSLLTIAACAAYCCASVHGQSFSGIRLGAVTTPSGYASVETTSAFTGLAVNTGGEIDMGVTLTPGHLQFGKLDYTSARAATLTSTVARTDPNTFETKTYNFTITFSPYQYHSVGGQALNLIPDSNGHLQFQATSTFIRDPINITGTYLVHGPTS